MQKLLTQQVEIYKARDGNVIVDVRLSEDTVWLSLQQLAVLFGRDKSVISRHIDNIFKEKELSKKATVANFATVQLEGKRKVNRNVVCYNLDAIISIGYRVNSKQGIQFRQWASRILKDYLIKGYSLNDRKFTKDSLIEIQNTISLVAQTLIKQDLINEAGAYLLEIVTDYSKTWNALFRFDNDLFEVSSEKPGGPLAVLTYTEAKYAIESFKESLSLKGETSDLFGHESANGLEAILGCISQTFDKKPLYPSNIQRAANLIYLVIKDHPFTDGNKRIGSLLFLLYLKKSKLSLNKISANHLTALALLIAESEPDQKGVLIKLIMHMLNYA